MFGLRNISSSCSRLPVGYQGFNRYTATFGRSYFTVSKEDATTRVLNVIKAFDKVNPEAVKPEAHFIKDLGLDSLDVVELNLALEEEFAIEMPDADAESILSVADAVTYLSKHPQTR